MMGAVDVFDGRVKLTGEEFLGFGEKYGNILSRKHQGCLQEGENVTEELLATICKSDPKLDGLKLQFLGFTFFFGGEKVKDTGIKRIAAISRNAKKFMLCI